MKKKIVLISCAIVPGIVILGFIGREVWRSYGEIISWIFSSHLEMPDELKHPGVVVGANFLSKERMVQDTRLGTITDIVLGECASSLNAKIALVGVHGALFLDENMEKTSSTRFQVRTGYVDMIDLEGDMHCEYLDRGGGWQDVSLLDHTGNVLWTYGGSPGVNNICAGDIDGDGILEFVVGFNGGGGVRLLDRNGQEQWQQSDGNVWHVELVDTNDDGILEIVHSNAAGKITVRDRQGKILSQAKPIPYFSQFSLCRWPSKQDREYALLADDDIIWVLDFDGQAIAQLDAPQSGKLGHARGVPLTLLDNQPDYFAVIVEFHNWDKSIFYLYGQDNALVYQEIMSEACASLAAISHETARQESLLVGGKGNVWKYSAVK